MAGRRPPTLETLFVVTFGLFGLRLGLRPIADNSTFLHLATGIEIAHGLGIPRSDPYSYTAAGTPWVVQSWLAEAAYGVLHRIGGMAAVQIAHGFLYGSIAVLVARLARTGVAWRTCTAAAAALACGVAYWSPRPLAVGLLSLAVLVTVVERGHRAWWLLPVAWVWVNSHGSFVLGAVWLVAVVVGQRLDGDRRPPALAHLAAFGAGLVLATVNPLGPRLLAFPAVLLARRDVFAQVVEWQSPPFTGGRGLLTLAGVLACVALLLASRRRPAWADVVPSIAFLGAALAAQRNLPVAAIVLAAPVGRALLPAARATGGEQSRPPAHFAVAGALVLAGAVFVAGALQGPHVELEGYPVGALGRLANADRVGRGLVHPDVVGGLLVLQHGRSAQVFVDDRFDMYPRPFLDDYVRLERGRPGSLAVLERYGARTVLWEEDGALAALLAASDRWRLLERRDGWVVFVRA